jgi:hypothetical protein
MVVDELRRHARQVRLARIVVALDQVPQAVQRLDRRGSWLSTPAAARTSSTPAGLRPVTRR